MIRICSYGLASVFCIPLAMAAPNWADKNRGTPNLVQTDFGRNGAALPFDGANYCGPTSASMALGYLNGAGFTQLLGPTVRRQDYLNLVKVMSGLMGTSDSGGSNGVQALRSGLTDYFAAKGISASSIKITPAKRSGHRTLAQIAASDVGRNILVGSIGWYQQTNGLWSRNGGHFVVVTDQSETTNTLTIHNPYPKALLDQPNLPSYVLQTLPVVGFAATRENTGGALADATYLQFDTTQVGPSLAVQGVLEDVQTVHVAATALPASEFVPVAWRIDHLKTLNSGGGDLMVDTQVVGRGGICKRDEGNVVFNREVLLTGQHQVRAGGLISRMNRGLPFGSGPMALSGTGRLALHPDDTDPIAVNLRLASRAASATSNGGILGFAGGNKIALDRGGNPSLVVTIGGNRGNGIPNLAPQGWAATLVIEADDLGGQEQVRVFGHDGNLPPVHHGMVEATLVGGSGPEHNGSFLRYVSTPADHSGFRRADSQSGDVNAATSTTVYRATVDQQLERTVDLYALQVEAGVAIRGVGRGLHIGDGVRPAGLILNGGRIEVDVLNFGNSPATIYTNLTGGQVRAELAGEHGLVKFGPGRLVLESPSPGLKGPVIVNSGAVVVKSSGALGEPGSRVTLRQGSVLTVASGVALKNTIRAEGSASINLHGGTLGDVSLQSATGPTGPIQGATLRGAGTISGNLVLNGYLGGRRNGAPGALTIGGEVTAASGGAYIWSLPRLVDNQSGSPGVNWNSVTLTNSNATFGTSTQRVAFLFDFAPGQGPDSGNAFWAQDHEWTVFTFPNLTSAKDHVYLSFPSQAFSAGQFTYHYLNNSILLYWTANPAPAQ